MSSDLVAPRWLSTTYPHGTTWPIQNRIHFARGEDETNEIREVFLIAAWCWWNRGTRRKQKKKKNEKKNTHTKATVTVAAATKYACKKWTLCWTRIHLMLYRLDCRPYLHFSLFLFFYLRCSRVSLRFFFLRLNARSWIELLRCVRHIGSEWISSELFARCRQTVYFIRSVCKHFFFRSLSVSVCRCVRIASAVEWIGRQKRNTVENLFVIENNEWMNALNSICLFSVRHCAKQSVICSSSSTTFI